jgi:hypothetical protein
MEATAAAVLVGVLLCSSGLTVIWGSCAAEFGMAGKQQMGASSAADRHCTGLVNSGTVLRLQCCGQEKIAS